MEVAVAMMGGGDGQEKATRRLLGIIVLLLIVLLACGACTLLSVSPLGDAFWRGFAGGG